MREPLTREDILADRLEHSDNYVYRAFDEFGLLLYIGCTANVDKRMATHSALAPWHRYMRRYELAGPWRRSEAMRRERVAIETERPYFNALKAETAATQAARVAVLRGETPCPAVTNDDRLTRYQAARLVASFSRMDDFEANGMGL